MGYVLPSLLVHSQLADYYHRDLDIAHDSTNARADTLHNVVPPQASPRQNFVPTKIHKERNLQRSDRFLRLLHAKYDKVLGLSRAIAGYRSSGDRVDLGRVLGYMEDMSLVKPDVLQAIANYGNEVDQTLADHIPLSLKECAFDYLRHDRPDEATACAEMALALVETTDQRSYVILEYTYSLCHIYEAIEEYELIVPRLLSVLEHLNQYLLDEPYLLEAMHMLARTYFNIEHAAEAERWHRKLLDRMGSCGVNDMRTAVVMRGLAMTLLDVGKLEDARYWARESVKLAKKR